jgi:two-component sensor histidine kinase
VCGGASRLLWTSVVALFGPYSDFHTFLRVLAYIPGLWSPLSVVSSRSPSVSASCSNAIKFAAQRVRLTVSLQLPAADSGQTGARSPDPASRRSSGFSLLFSPRRGVTTAVESQPLLASRGVASTPPASPAQRCMIRFAVEDDGAGIPAEEQALLFKPFAQAVAGIRKQGGTGLGLTICKALVEAHGGEIGFESTSGKHTVFTVDIPFGAAQTDSTARQVGDASLLAGGSSPTPTSASPLGRQLLPSAAPMHGQGLPIPRPSAPPEGDGAVSGEAPAVAAVNAVRVMTEYHSGEAAATSTSAADVPVVSSSDEEASRGVDEGLQARPCPSSSHGDGDHPPSTAARAALTDTDDTGAAALEAHSSEAVLPSDFAAGVACSVPDGGAAASAAGAQLQGPAPLPLLRLRAKETSLTSTTPHALSPAAEGTLSAATDSSTAVGASWSCPSSTAVTTPTSTGGTTPVRAVYQRYHFLVVDDGA